MALASFQVLAIIGAGAAMASGTCNYVLASQRVDVIIDTGTGSTLSVSDGSVAGTVAGDILFDGAACGGSPKISNTVQVNVTTTVPSGAEAFTIDNTFGAATDQEFPSTIAWFVDLGTGTGDILQFLLSGDLDNTLVATDTSFTLNEGPGTTAGVENIFAIGAAAPAANQGDDTIDGSALSANVLLLAFGGGGIDVISPGAHLGDIVDGGGQAGDTLSYGNRTTATIINDPAGFAGFDANGNGTLVAPEELDAISNFDTFETGSGNDELNGTAGDDWFIPGDGDDRVAGLGGVFDVLDYSTSSAGMVIDPGAGTATGQGADTFTGVEAFVGSAFDDSLLWPAGGVAGFAGGDGIDTVDASARTTAQVINLDTLDDVVTASTDSTENVLGGSASDTLTGNDLRNDLQGNDGDDTLSGAAGNDTLTGGLGNDSFSGGSGADKISYATNTTDGIEADMNLGFVTSSESGDDGVIGGDVEIVQGSPFNDSITGGGGLVTGNFIFTGGNGKDTLTGSGSNDTLKGGAGNDRLRGLEGGDTLKGGKGKDKGWGGPGVDFCTGVEVEKGCE
jgi:Ca2+-binding RTX toxin-like protein